MHLLLTSPWRFERNLWWLSRGSPPPPSFSPFNTQSPDTRLPNTRMVPLPVRKRGWCDGRQGQRKYQLGKEWRREICCREPWCHQKIYPSIVLPPIGWGSWCWGRGETLGCDASMYMYEVSEIRHGLYLTLFLSTNIVDRFSLVNTNI